MSLEFKVCPHCGLRNAVRPGSTRLSADHCAQCSPPTTAFAFNVQVHGMSHGEGQPAIAYRVRILDPNGEVVFSKEPMERDEARAMAKEISENIIAFLDRMGI